MTISHFVDSLDLRGVFTLLGVVGAMLAVFVMQKTRFEAEDRQDPWALRMARTVSLALLAICFLWTVNYGFDRQWMPWPPIVALAAVMDLLLAIRATAIFYRLRRTGPYIDAPSMAARSRLSR